MKVEKREKYTLITPNEDSFAQFLEAFQETKARFNTENIIISLLGAFDSNNTAIASFLTYAEEKKGYDTSLVMVAATKSIDDFPETFNIAPTLEEAEDLLEMELIARELGF